MTYTGRGRKTWRLLSPIILAIVWGGVMQPRSVASWFHAISVAMEQWTLQHCAFVVEVHFKNGDSAVTTQTLFRRHFNIPHHGRVPCRNTIKEWVQNFQENASALKRKPPEANSFGTNTRKCWYGKDGYCEEFKAFSEEAFHCHSTIWLQRVENFAQGS